MLSLCFGLGGGAVCAQSGFDCDGWYFLAMSTAGQTAIYAQRPDEAAYPELQRSVDLPLNAVGYRPGDGLLYGIDALTGDFWRVGRELFQEKLGAALVDPARQYLAGDVSPDGRYLYVLVAEGPFQNAFDAALLKIDLEDSAYTITETPLSRTDLRSLDIAFDPTDGTLYGWDGFTGQLLTIGTDGTVALVGVAQTPPGSFGGLFFDAFGKLYGFGAGNLPDALHLFAIDKNEGTLTYLRDGPQAAGIDACACYRTLEVNARVDRPTVDPCAPLRYTVSIANWTAAPQTGVALSDALPAGFVLDAVLANPFGGAWNGGVGAANLSLTAMTVPPGIDSLVLLLSAPAGTPPGTYATQATLSAPVLTTPRRADNALTPVPGDSVRWQLNGVPTDALDVELFLCDGAARTLDPAAWGTPVDWADGYVGAVRTVRDAGTYAARVSNGCDTTLVTYRLIDSDLFVNFEPATVSISLGDSVRLFPLTPVSNVPTTFAWRDPLDGSLSCLDCPRPFASPYVSTTYTLAAEQGGCVDSASVTVLVETELGVYLPSAFSPNEDGVNDKFYPQGSADVRILQLELYNRWGEPVFFRRDLPINVVAEGWDGTYRGRAVDPGVYVYHAEIEARDGSRKRVTGSVALMR